MNPAELSRSTKVVVFIAALVCTTFPNGGDDFVLEVIERGRFHLGATLLNCVWISLVSIGLLWLLRQMSGYAKRGGWQQPLSLLGCLVAISVFIGVFRVLLSEKVQPVSVLIFLLIWAGMAVRTLAVVFRSQVPAKPAQNPTDGTPLEGGSQPTPSIPDAPPQDSPKPDPAPQSPIQHRRASQNGAANPLIAPGAWITVILCLLLQAAAWSGGRTPLAEWLGQSLFLAYLFLCIPALFPRQKRSTSFIASAFLALFYLAGLSVASVITELFVFSVSTTTFLGAVEEITLRMVEFAIFPALLAAMCVGYALFRRGLPPDEITEMDSGTVVPLIVDSECASANDSLPQGDQSPVLLDSDSSRAATGSWTRRGFSPYWLVVLIVLGAGLAMANGYILTQKTVRAAQERAEFRTKLMFGTGREFDEMMRKADDALRARLRADLATRLNTSPTQPEPLPIRAIDSKAALTSSPTTQVDSVAEEVVRFYNEMMGEVMALNSSYSREFQEIDIETCVRPSRMKNDPGFADATAKIQRAKAVIAKFKPVSMGLVPKYRTKIENMPVSDRVKAAMLAGFDKSARDAVQDLAEHWALEEDMMDKVDETVRFLATRNTWIIRDQKMSFTKQADLDGFRELINAMGMISQRQQAIKEKNRAAISASLGEMETPLRK